MAIKSEIEFHETFQPQAEYISAVLELAAREYVGTKEKISECTGIPTGKQKGKVVPHLKYARYMNLIDFDFEKAVYSLKLTPLGKRVYQDDPYLMEDLTLHLCNYFLTQKGSGAPQWDFIFHQVPYLIEEPTETNFVKNKCNGFFGFNVELGVVKNSYLTGMFERLGVLDWNEKEIIHRRGLYSEEYLHLYAYTLLYSWEKLFPENNELVFPEIINSIGWGASFGFDESDVSMMLDILSDSQYVHVNRQLYPVTVVKLRRSDEALDQMYSNLI